MDEWGMNTKLGTKWFTFYTKVRPILSIFGLLSAYGQYVAYKGYIVEWYLIYILLINVFQTAICIFTMIVSYNEYHTFVKIVKRILIIEVILMSIQFGMNMFINNGLSMRDGSVSFIIMFIFSYLVWYKLNIKYFEKRLIVRTDKGTIIEIEKNPRKKINFSLSFSSVLAAVSILSMIIAIFVQDAKRDIYEFLMPTIVYIILAGIYGAFIIVQHFIDKDSVQAKVITFVPAVISIAMLIEGSVFSNNHHLYINYANKDIVNVLNAVWVLCSFLIILANRNMFKGISKCWYNTVLYREKQYKKVEKIKHYLDIGVITQEEYEKNKREILKNINK